jgi:Integrase core domain
MAHATVSRCLQRRGLSRMPRPEREQVRRYSWPCPGDLLQIDTKQFANFSRPVHAVTGDRHRIGAEKRLRVGKRFAHSIIDDHSRLAYTELHADEKAATVTAFVERALEFFAGHGIQAAVAPSTTTRCRARRLSAGARGCQRLSAAGDSARPLRRAGGARVGCQTW